MCADKSCGRVYACIDLKSFYASVECVERGLDPFKTNLVVADPDRESGTICLAITPAMKALGIKNRCRVFEIPKNVKYIMAKPRMNLYMKKSAQIYSTYLRYISPDDIHVYSIDECFIDLTPYLKLYKKGSRALVKFLIEQVFLDTGIPAAAGIGTNLFLSKVALDITAKHSPDFIGYLDEDAYAKTAAHHRPITDIWNVGPGIAARLSHLGVYDMAGIKNIPESTLYREFGVNAEYLIDHAYGREPCTIAEIKAYTPSTASMTNGQVLFQPYTFEEGKIILREMVETSVLEMIEKRLATDSISLMIGYNYSGKYGTPTYYRPKSTGGSVKLGVVTNSLKTLTESFLSLYERTTNRDVKIKKVSIGLGNLVNDSYVTCDMFTDTEKLEREHSLLRAIVDIKGRFGKNSIVKGVSFEEKATARARNLMVGGHNGG